MLEPFPSLHRLRQNTRDCVDIAVILERKCEIFMNFLNIFCNYINFYYSFSDTPCEEKQSIQPQCRPFNNGERRDG
jgi:hypothetical protein